MPRRSSTPSTEGVLDAAEQIIATEGVGALTMRRLADAVGASYQVVYSRLGGRGEVFRALHGRGWRRLTERVMAMTGEAAVPDVDALVEFSCGYLDFAADQPVMFDVMTGSPVAEFVRDDQARQVEWQAFRRCWGALAHAWHAQTMYPVSDEEPPRLSAADIDLGWRLWTAVHGITVVHLAGHPSPDGGPEAGIDAQVRAIVGG